MSSQDSSEEKSQISVEEIKSGSRREYERSESSDDAAAASDDLGGVPQELPEFPKSAMKLLERIPEILAGSQDIARESQGIARESHSIAKKWEKRNFWLTIVLIFFATVQAIGLLVEPNEVREYFAHRFGPDPISFEDPWIHSSVHPLMHPFLPQRWRHMIRIDEFDGIYKASRVVAVGEKGRLAARAYEGRPKREMILETHDRICVDSSDRKLAIRIKMDGKVHEAMTRMSGSKTTLLFDSPSKWIEKMNAHNRFAIRIDDDCGTRTDLVFRTAGKIDLSFD